LPKQEGKEGKGMSVLRRRSIGTVRLLLADRSASRVWKEKRKES